jgi:ribosomal protein L37E
VPPPQRHRDDRETRFTLSTPTREDPTLVVCPTCGAKAFVLPAPDAKAAVRVVCHACGFAKTTDGTTRRFAWNAETPTDGYFGLDLWLQTRCAGHVLWAFNRRHLDLLDHYVAASLRERRRGEEGWRNASLVSRLPSWMTAAAHREDVLAALAALRAKL